MCLENDYIETLPKTQRKNIILVQNKHCGQSYCKLRNVKYKQVSHNNCVFIRSPPIFRELFQRLLIKQTATENPNSCLQIQQKYQTFSSKDAKLFPLIQISRGPNTFCMEQPERNFWGVLQTIFPTIFIKIFCSCRCFAKVDVGNANVSLGNVSYFVSQPIPLFDL